MEILEVPMANRVEAMLVKNGTAVFAYVFNVCEYLQKNLFLKFLQIEQPGMRLSDTSLPYVTPSCISGGKYGVNSAHGTLSVAFHPDVSADDMTTPSKDGMTARRQVLNNDANVFFVDGHHRTVAI